MKGARRANNLDRQATAKEAFLTDHSELQGAQETYVPAPTPANEKERIAALHALDILDSAEEDIYNAITQAAADACQTSMASLTFVDSARQWFKARVGLTARETARDVSFCGHAIAGHELFVVENALEDARFRHNPFVTGAPNLRFYAGMPLTVDSGLSVGTLCVLDANPRQLTETQSEALRTLAQSAIRVLQLRRANGVAVFAKAVDMTSDGVTIAGNAPNGMTIMYANESFLRMTGRSYVEAIDQPPTFPFDYSRTELNAALEDASASAQMRTVDCQLERPDGEKLWFRVSFVPYVDEAGKLVYLVTVHRDVTAIRETEAQTQQLYAMRTTLATIQHVANNFMHSASLYSNYMSSYQTADPAIQQSFDKALEQTRSQLRAMARMPAFKDRATPFGFSMLDVEED